MTEQQIDEVAKRLWAEAWELPLEAWRHLTDEVEKQRTRRQVVEVIAALREAGFAIVEAEDGR